MSITFFPSDIKDNWRIRQSGSMLDKGVSFFIFEHKTIVDDAGVRISPTMSFIFELLDRDLDATEYSSITREKSTMVWSIDKTYSSEDNLFPWKKAVGYKGHFAGKDGTPYTVYIIHGTFTDNGKTYGVQIIMESTNSVISKVEPEYTALLARIGGGQ